VTEIGVFTPEEFALRRQSPDEWEQRLPVAAMGALRMLQEMQAQFDFVTTDRDLAAYKLLILPDCIPVDPDLAARLGDYVASGGALLLSAESMLGADGAASTAPWMPAHDMGASPYEPDFVVPGPEMIAAEPRLQASPYVMYRRGRLLAAQTGSTRLAEVERPYFNREWRHFCSHQHSPSSGDAAGPAVVRKGNVICVAHPVFTMYHDRAPLWCRNLVSACVRMLLPGPVVLVEGPSSLLTILTEQTEPRRRVLHLLHYIPERRGQAFDVIEDVLPVYDVRCRVSAPGASSVRLVPDDTALPFALEGGRVLFTVPVIRGHAMVEIR
jgi:hypothetical protein